MNKARRILLIALLGGLAFAAASCSTCRRAPAPAKKELIVRFLDVGQGDAALLELPGGEKILIDSGPTDSPALKLLEQFDVNRLDLVVATHPHEDHIGRMRDIMRQFQIGEFWDSGFAHPTRTYREMLEEIKRRKIKLQLPRRGTQRQFGPVSIEVLHPGETLPEEANNASLVLKVSYGQQSFLFTGDAELEAWREMLSLVGHDKMRADVMKAAHHGSSNGISKEILEAVQPSAIIISCGAGNDYHHPHPRTIKLLASRRNFVRLYRTDLQGTITAATDGQKLEITAERLVAQDDLYMTGDEAAGRGRERGMMR
jgi:competence protein ComEC